MNYVIGIDFGSDSVRSILVDSSNGEELGSSIHYYRRWKDGLYCDAVNNRFRQHPMDYIEGIEATIKGCIKEAGEHTAQYVKGISVDTTGSTPVAVDKQGTPLALTPEFEENPNAMFVLWKDHTATAEADEINRLAKNSEIDYTQYVGGIYSSEWFWAKILKVSRDDAAVSKAAYTWVEHCDWVPYLLTGGSDVTKMKISRCAAGHKAMWHELWGGLPPNDYFARLDPLLDGLVDRMYKQTNTSDEVAGMLSQEWAERLGLSEEVTVGVGAFDAHMGAVGGQIQPYYLSKIMGTSTCDILISPKQDQEHLVKGICGQVDGSVVPGMLGLEAGQSAFGDVYAWYGRLIEDPIVDFIKSTSLLDPTIKEQLIAEIKDKLIQQLVKSSAREEIGSGGVLSLEWMNGRRTPDANQRLKGVINGLNLGSTSAKVFRSLIEATCYGARKIVERFIEEGIEIKGIIALGGVAKKSPMIMQMMADVMNRTIAVAKSEQTCALGAAMFAAVHSGIYPDIHVAMQQMGQGFETEYTPDPEAVKAYDYHYQKYCKLALEMEAYQKKTQEDES